MEINEITERIIAAAIKVHSTLGPGLFEKTYKDCLFTELQSRGLSVKKELLLPIVYENLLIETAYRIDMLVESEVVLELKAVEQFSRLHRTQLLTYLKLSNRPVGLLLNFNAPRMVNGIVRIVRGYSGSKPSEKLSRS